MNEKLSEMQQLLYELKQAQMKLQKMSPTDWEDEATLRSSNGLLKSALTLLKQTYPDTLAA